jgi:TM2 domain-containing membrane protein YozV
MRTLSEFQVPQTPQTPGTPQRDWLTALLLSIFLGGLGVYRFYLGRNGIGVAKLLTFGGCGVWHLVDIILIATDQMKDAQGRPMVRR